MPDGELLHRIRRVPRTVKGAGGVDSHRHRNVPVASAAVRAAGGVPDEWLVGDVAAVVNHLRSLPGSNGKIGVIEHCSGGRQAFLAACSLAIDAAVDCYGAFVVNEPPPGMPSAMKPIIGLAPQLSCPLLGLFGAEDTHPSPEETAALSAELHRLGKPHEFHTYDGAGHAFMAVDHPNYRPEAAWMAGNASSISQPPPRYLENSLRLPNSTAELFRWFGTALLWSSGSGARRNVEMGHAPEVRQRILELSMSVWAFAALSFALEAGVLDELSTPSTVRQISQRTGIPEDLVNGVLDVLVALGFGTADEHGFVASPGLVAVTSGRAKELLAAELRCTRLQTAELVERATSGTIALDGWSYSDPDLLQAQGLHSAQMVVPWVERLFPNLQGLSERLKEPTATFLDVGSGVGRLSIEMCRRFPNLRVVGIDPFETPLTLARRNVAEAGLGDRIELRPERVQDLTDERSYDLAWVPVLFMAADVAARGLHRVRSALRPGGWAVLGSLAVEGAEIQPALLRLVSLLYGSGGLSPEQAAAMLTAAGFENVLALPAMRGVAGRTIVGRRPVDE